MDCRDVGRIHQELAHLAAKAKLFLEVDASGSHVGAVLHQGDSQTRWPLGFFSIKLEPSHHKYSAFDRELLACYLVWRHCEWILVGKRFHHPDRPQATNFRFAPLIRCLDSEAAVPPVIQCEVHLRCQASSRQAESCSRHSLQASGMSQTHSWAQLPLIR